MKKPLFFTQTVAKDFAEFSSRRYDPNGERKLAEEWLTKKPKTEEQYINFYKECNYLDELVDWHSRSNKNAKKHQLARTLKIVSKLSITDVLDIGAGIGTDCLEFANMGLEVSGLEPNPKSVEFAKWRAAKYNLHVNFRVGTEKDIEGVYDLITFFDVIEHFHDPYDSLNHIVEKKPMYLLFTQAFGVHEEDRGGHPQHSDHSKIAIAKHLVSLGYRKIKLIGVAFPPQLYVNQYMSDCESLVLKE